MMSAPMRIGRCKMGVAKQLSTAKSAPNFSFSEKSYQDVKAAVEDWYSERIALILRIYVYPPIPRGIGARCNLCSTDLDGFLPSVCGYRSISVQCRRCHTKSYIKRKKTDAYMSYFTLCFRIRGFAVPGQRRRSRPMGAVGGAGAGSGGGVGAGQFDKYD